MHPALLLSVALLVLSGCERHLTPIVGCVASGDLIPICGFSSPEDMELLPDGHTLLISEMGGLSPASPGSLALYDTNSETITRLPQSSAAGDGTWGAADCTTPPGPAFSPHGMDLTQRADGRWQVLVVNHGGRESVEFFELQEQAAGWRLQWRGCAVAPSVANLNDVVALPDGGFLATHMAPRDSFSLGLLNFSLLKGMLGLDTGYVLHWDGTQYTRMPGSDAPLPNGIQVSPDGTTVYLDAYLAGEVRKLRYPDGALLGTAQISYPDNSQWDGAGHLLVASHPGGLLDIGACLRTAPQPCGAAFAITRLDTQTMLAHTLISHHGAPMGAATVAQRVGDHLYLGSFLGDRIVRIRLPMQTSTPDPRRTP